MGFQDAMDALHLKMPKRIPRTEYSASGHWDLIRAVTGRPVFQESSWEEKSAAAAVPIAWGSLYVRTFIVSSSNQYSFLLCICVVEKSIPIRAFFLHFPDVLGKMSRIL